MPSTHDFKVISFCNGGAKARRFRCSCGALGVRFAYGPMAGGRTIARATEKAQADGDQHVADVTRQHALEQLSTASPEAIRDELLEDLLAAAWDDHWTGADDNVIPVADWRRAADEPPVLPDFYGKPIDTPTGHRWAGQHDDEARATRRRLDDRYDTLQHGDPRCLTDDVDGECVCT